MSVFFGLLKSVMKKYQTALLLTDHHRKSAPGRRTHRGTSPSAFVRQGSLGGPDPDPQDRG